MSRNITVSLATKVKVRVITFGPDAHCREDTSPVKARIQGNGAEHAGKFRSRLAAARGRTCARPRDKDIPIIQQAQMVKSGVVRVMELRNRAGPTSSRRSGCSTFTGERGRRGPTIITSERGRNPLIRLASLLCMGLFSTFLMMRSRSAPNVDHRPRKAATIAAGEVIKGLDPNDAKARGQASAGR